MHASTEQLLSLRDGDPVEATLASHVEGCGQCASELERLAKVRTGLRELPQIEPPVGGWAAIEARLDAPGPDRLAWWPALAAAVVAAVAAGVWIALPGDTQTRAADTTLADAAPATAAPAVADTRPRDGQQPDAAARDVSLLMAESRELEQLLRVLSDRSPRVMRAGTAGAIAELEDGIAMIDYGLTYNNRLSGDDSEQLWRSRVDLMNTLVQVRGAQLQKVSN